MEEKNNTTETVKKLTYEQLENIAHQLSNQVNTLYAKLQESNMANAFKRLDYLFKVIENKDNFNNTFITKCIDEIVDIMTVEPEHTTEDKSEE